jgi:ankyrin repeat protein
MQVLSSFHFQGSTTQRRSPSRPQAIVNAQSTVRPADSFVSSKSSQANKIVSQPKFAGKTELMKAAESGDYQAAYDICFQEVLSHQWEKINEKYGGKTAIMMAVENGYTKIAELLAAEGACLSLTDNNGRTVLDRISDKNLKKELINIRGSKFYSDTYDGYNSQDERRKK